MGVWPAIPWLKKGFLGGHGDPEKPLAQEKEDRGSGSSLAFKPWYLPSPRPTGSSQKPIPREQQLRINLRAEPRPHDPADSARLKPQLYTGQADNLPECARAAFSQGPAGFLQRESANRARTYMHGRHGALWPPLYPGTAQGVQGLPWVVGMMPSGHPYTLAQQKQAC